MVTCNINTYLVSNFTLEEIINKIMSNKYKATTVIDKGRNYTKIQNEKKIMYKTNK